VYAEKELNRNLRERLVRYEYNFTELTSKEIENILRNMDEKW